MHVPRLHIIYCISTCCNTLQSRYYSTCPITLGSSDIVLIIEKMLKCSDKYGFTCREPPQSSQQKKRKEKKYPEVSAITLFHNPFALCHFLCSLHLLNPFRSLCRNSSLSSPVPVWFLVMFSPEVVDRDVVGRIFSLELCFETGSRGLPKMLGRGNVVWLIAHSELLVNLINTMQVRNAMCDNKPTLHQMIYILFR